MRERKIILGCIMMLVVLSMVNAAITPDIHVYKDKDGIMVVYQIDDKEIYPRPVTKTDFLEGNIIEESR